MSPAVGAVPTMGAEPLCREVAAVPGRRLCLVSVPVFIDRYLSRVRFGDGLARPPVPLSAFVAPLDFLSPEERAQVQRFFSLKKQVEWVCGRLAAKTAVASAAGLGPDLKHIRLAYQREGAPYVGAMPELPLSIAHSGARAVAVAGGRGRIGIDIEPVPAGDLGFLLQAGFSRRERKALMGAPTLEIIRSWTLKEAFLKFIGRGFNESLAAVEILQGRIHHHGRPVENLKVIQDSLGGGYVMSLVYATPDD